MYGTIMRAKVKPGRKAEYQQAMQAMVPSPEDYGRGLVALQIAWEDKDPDRIVMIVFFKDRDSYIANANRPDTNTQYEQQLDYLEGPPEWIDVNYGEFVGNPLGEGAATA